MIENHYISFAIDLSFVYDRGQITNGISLKYERFQCEDFLRQLVLTLNVRGQSYLGLTRSMANMAVDALAP